MRMLLAIFFSLIAAAVSAQEKVYTIKPGERISDVIKKEEMYRYPSFQVGRVFFRSNETANGRLNLSFLTGEMHFIDNKGDTMALDNEETVKYIAIAKDTFFFSNGFVQQVEGTGDWKLARKQEFRMVKQDKVGAYDQSMPSAAVSYTSIRLGNQLTDNLMVRETTTLVQQTEFFIGDKYNRFLPVNKKNIMKLFGRQEQKVEAYLAQNPVNFNKESDVRPLFAFLLSLQ